MCYGDPHHGKDGYYKAWIDRQYERQEQEQEQQPDDPR